MISNESREHVMIYFDNAATSWPKPPEVLSAMADFMEKVGANPGRSGHQLSLEAGRIVLNTREKVAGLFGIKDSSQVIFTLNGTYGLNLGIKGLLKEGDRVVLTSMEHNSVMRPLRHLEETKKVKLTIIQCQKDGQVDLGEVRKALEGRVSLVITTHASNVTGGIMPLREIGEMVKEKEAVFMVDACQSAGSLPIDVEEMRIDLLAFTGHKGMFGPQGVGGLYIREGIEFEPLVRGGTGSNSEHEVQPDFLPDKYESGTLNTVAIAGLGAGVEFIVKTGISEIREREKVLIQMLIEGIRGIEGIEMYGPEDTESRIAICSFNLKGRDPAHVGYLLDREFGIMCRVGLQCAPAAHRAIGTYPQGTVRFSLGYFNCEEDVSSALDALKKIREMT
jgi:cysteine desulfurase family protein